MEFSSVYSPIASWVLKGSCVAVFICRRWGNYSLIFKTRTFLELESFLKLSVLFYFLSHQSILETQVNQRGFICMVIKLFSFICFFLSEIHILLGLAIQPIVLGRRMPPLLCMTKKISTEMIKFQKQLSCTRKHWKTIKTFQFASAGFSTLQHYCLVNCFSYKWSLQLGTVICWPLSPCICNIKSWLKNPQQLGMI